MDSTKCSNVSQRGVKCSLEVIRENLCCKHYNQKMKDFHPHEKCIGILKSGKLCSKDAKKDQLCGKHNTMKENKEHFEIDADRNQEYFKYMEDQNFKPCISGCHSFTISIYPKNRVPISLFLKDPDNPNSKSYGSCIDCRNKSATYDKQEKAKLKRKVFLENGVRDENYKFCSSERHTSNVSKYPKERVPLEYFFENPEDRNSKEFSVCIDCRTKDREYNSEIRKRNREARNNMKDDPNFRVCISSQHCPSISKYPRDRVPIKLFLENPDDSESKIYKHCEDCRKYNIKAKKEWENNKLETLKDGEFLCKCGNIYDISERVKNIDGSEGTMCVSCKEYQKEYGIKRYENRKEDQQYIILKLIEKNKASCENCKCIFLKPVADTKYAVTLETYEYNGIRCIDYGDRTYRTSDFIKRFENLLELRILEMDHLTEEEQRERGILQPDEPFKPKANCIAKLEGKALIEEFKKIQVLCCKCHIIITESRQQGIDHRTNLTREKIAYTEEMKKSGCSVCSFYDENILRFLEFDHINPKDKLRNISHMKIDRNVSLEDIKNELKKTRVICRHCHRIHTAEQLERGEISNEKFYEYTIN